MLLLQLAWNDLKNKLGTYGAALKNNPAQCIENAMHTIDWRRRLDKAVLPADPPSKIINTFTARHARKIASPEEPIRRPAHTAQPFTPPRHRAASALNGVAYG